MDTQLTGTPVEIRDDETETAEISPPIPSGTDEAFETPEGVEGNLPTEKTVRVTARDDPFPPDGEETSSAADVTRGGGPAVRYIFLLICLILGAVAVIVVGTGIKDAVGKSWVGVPRIFYSGMFNSGLSEIPKAGNGVILSGRIVTPPAPSVGEDGSVEPPGALEPDGDERDRDGDPGIDLPIRSVDLSCREKDGLGLIDQTERSPDLPAIASRDRVIPPAADLLAEYGDGAPLVLIIHTHGTESYAPEGARTYSSDCDFRSIDPEEGVVAVGEAVKRTLEARGIAAIHVTDMFDAENFLTAYARSAEKVRWVLKESPSVKYVLDIHRDALITEEGVNLRPVTEYEGKSAAELMTVVGTDEAGSGHDGWRDNLALALYIQRRVGTVCPGLMRAVNLRSESFNQQLSPGYLLLEAGAAANSLSEAERGAEIYADALADYILAKGDA